MTSFNKLHKILYHLAVIFAIILSPATWAEESSILSTAIATCPEPNLTFYKDP